ncbi:hypothetical protein J7J08_07045 [Stenotrophomonas sp. ISL-67]|uniref:hypothetical protein n=1 Tax=Stenotrophomonas sp. ISL-67 TaxID=2819171 RepID=UPI001BE9B9BD|nr:hypothetical protein [Stenotrophomonas sp. ISL-67]MBT2767391.1 hypothetical protein [Stenotrophomonas sp. ISL-67]
MKVQLQHQSVRVRVDEDELARLLAGQTLSNLTRLGTAPPWALLIVLGTQDAASLEYEGHAPRIVLPAGLITAYSGRLPCRDGLSFRLEQGHEALQVQFDVDVRDSIRQRGATRRGTVDVPVS